MTKQKKQKHPSMQKMQENYNGEKRTSEQDQGRIENINVYEQHLNENAE